MPFPDYERVIYEKNPLIEVICQLRFPPILSINTKEPADFQEYIRSQFPIYELKIEQHQQISFNIQAGPPMMQAESNRNHNFLSLDKQWRIGLTSTFISLSTSNYLKWEEFEEKFALPLEALLEVYKPAFFDRIGLRYIDVFNRKKLDLTDKSWSDLISPYALGFLSADKVISSRVRMNNLTSEINLDDNISIARIIISLGNVNNDPEECFILDSDLFTLGNSGLDVWSKVKYLHDRSRRLMQWIITEDLHRAMGATKV